MKISVIKEDSTIILDAKMFEIKTSDTLKPGNYKKRHHFYLRCKEPARKKYKNYQKQA